MYLKTLLLNINFSFNLFIALPLKVTHAKFLRNLPNIYPLKNTCSYNLNNISFQNQTHVPCNYLNCTLASFILHQNLFGKDQDKAA